MPQILYLLLIFLISTTVVHADLAKSSQEGFIVEHSITFSQDRQTVFKAMTSDIGKWWDSSHSFSNDAANMLVDKQCFCERWENNLVHHLDTKIWIENSKVVLEGGLGPLKELGLSGNMVWSLKVVEDVGTEISWNYYVYGNTEADMTELAKAVNDMLKEQLKLLGEHLKK